MSGTVVTITGIGAHNQRNTQLWSAPLVCRRLVFHLCKWAPSGQNRTSQSAKVRPGTVSRESSRQRRNPPRLAVDRLPSHA